jgi:hypothetical protein
MTHSAVLDTILGLIAVFYALALLCGGLVEMIANWVKKRAKYLLRGLHDLLEEAVPPDAHTQGWMAKKVSQASSTTAAELKQYDSALRANTRTERPEVQPAAANSIRVDVNAVMGHPLVQPFRHADSLGKPRRNPAYLPSDVFARTVVDLLTPKAGAAELTGEHISAGIAALDGSPKLQQALTGLLKAANGDLRKFLAATEAWFDGQMERVTGSYKRWAKRWVIVIAAVVVGAGGVDAIAIARTVYADEAIRATVVQQVNDEKFCDTNSTELSCAEQARNFLEQSGLPLGWSKPNPQDGSWGWPLKLLGLLISIGAAALGAPFWYRLLDRVGSLRNTGQTPSPSKS